MENNNDKEWLNSRKKYTADILDCIAHLSSDEVFTSPKLANQVLDLLPEHVWSNKELKWLDPSCKTGVFLREIAKRLLIGLKEVIPDLEKRKEHILKNMLYGIALTELTALTSRRSLYYSKDASSKHSGVIFKNPEGNIEYKNCEHSFANDKTKKAKNTCSKCFMDKKTKKEKVVENSENHAYQFIHEEIDEVFKKQITKGDSMKFNVIIGNPPYQMKDGGAGSSATPLYHLFIQQAKKLNPDYLSMIIPARWYCDGKGLDEFRAEMLKDKTIKTLVDHPDPSECFPGVEIKGGVCYFLMDKNHNGDCEVINKYKTYISKAIRDLNYNYLGNESETGYLIRFNEAINIINKVVFYKDDNGNVEQKLNTQISSRKPFGLSTTIKTESKLAANKTLCYIRNGIGYVDSNLVVDINNWVEKYKVLISKAYGAGEGFPHQIIGQPIVTEKNSCCSETYLVAGAFNTKLEAENFALYMRTKFFRFLVSQLKLTQNIKKDKFSFVPILDMNIKWTDELLYKKYKISDEEIKFIDSIVKNY